MTVLVGVDLGGTNIRAAIAGEVGTHGEAVDAKTPADGGPDVVLEAIAATVRQCSRGQAVTGVAIGIPGPLDPSSGVVYAAPHLRGWEGINAAQLLTAKVGAPVVIQNDANLAGYAEWVVGAGKGARDFVFMTVSTGVGGAIVCNGELIGGAAGTAGEVGHLPLGVDAPACGQGHPGCLEGTASGTAIAQAARRAMEQGRRSSLAQVSPADLDAKAVENAARDGDELAREIYSHAGEALGRALGGIINLLSPEVIAIGGGLILAGDLLFAPMRNAVSELAFAEPARRCRIVEAALGTDAGLVGACAWALRSFGN